MLTTSLRFATLCDHLTAAGCRVGVELRDDARHSILITGGNGRVVRAPVEGGFDRTAAIIVMSGALRHQGVAHDVDRGGWAVRGEWPELEALALEATA